MAERENLDRSVSLDSAPPSSPSSSPIMNNSSGNGQGQRSKKLDRQNTVNDLRNRLNQLDNRMKTIAVRDEAIRRASITGDRPIFMVRKSSTEDDAVTTLPSKPIRGVKFRREETQILDDVLDIPLVSSPRRLSDATVHPPPSSNVNATSASSSLRPDSENDRNSSNGNTQPGSNQTSEEKDRIARDVTKLKEEKALLLKELHTALEAELKAEKEENERLLRAKAELTATEESLDKELANLKSKLETLNESTQRQRAEAEKVLKSLEDEGASLAKRVEKAAALITQRQRRAKRARDGIELDEGEESETLSSLSEGTESKTDAETDSPTTSRSQDGTAAITEGSFFNGVPSSKPLSRSRSQSASESHSRSQSRSRGNSHTHSQKPKPESDSESDPKPSSSNPPRSSSTSSSSSSSSDRTSPRKPSSEKQNETVTASPASTAPSVSSSQNVSKSSQLLPSSVVKEENDENPPPKKKKKSGGCFSCFGGKK